MARSNSAFGTIFRRKGRAGFYVRVRLKGVEHTRWGGPDRDTATEYLSKLFRETSREALLGEKAIRAIPFASFAPVVEAHFRANHKESTVDSELGKLNRATDWFGVSPINEITAGDVQEFIDALADKSKFTRATVNRYLSLLSSVFKHAVLKGFAAENPVKQLDWQREEERSIPYTTNEDIDRLVAHARDERFGAFIRIAADTGLRRSELRALEWRDVYLARAVLLVRRSKSSKSREVGLTPEAQRQFAWLHEHRTTPITGANLVWPEWSARCRQAVSSRFKTVARWAGMGDLRLHDMRHSFCSRLAQKGVPLPTISMLAGHSSLGTTMKYAKHLPTGAGVDAIALLGGHKGTHEGTNRSAMS